MQEVIEPKLFLIAKPQLDTNAVLAYLESVHGDAWFSRTFPDGALGLPQTDYVPHAEALVEFAGRLCYRSWEPGLNANVTKIREDRDEYLTNVLASGHGSVLEHASFSFVLHNASRVLTAELNRHRAGCAISEQSLRFVRLDDLSFRLPPTLSQAAQNLMERAVLDLEEVIGVLIAKEIDDDMTFAEKKEKTSAIRRIAPLGLATEMVWTANVRALRHIITMRSAAGAEEEIRIFAKKLHALLMGEAPLLFKDYTLDHDGSLHTDFPKV